MVTPNECIDHSHLVSKINDTVIVPFTTFRHHTMFYRNSKALKGGATVHSDLTKSILDLIMKAKKYLKDISNAEFPYSDINCRLKFSFKKRRLEFFNSMEDLISKVGCLEGYDMKLPVVIICVCFAVCLMLQNMSFVFIILETYRWGCSVLGMFLKISTDLRRRLRWGFFLNNILRGNSGASVFFP